MANLFLILFLYFPRGPQEGVPSSSRFICNRNEILKILVNQRYNLCYAFKIVKHIFSLKTISLCDTAIPDQNF